MQVPNVGGVCSVGEYLGSPGKKGKKLERVEKFLSRRKSQNVAIQATHDRVQKSFERQLRPNG